MKEKIDWQALLMALACIVAFTLFSMAALQGMFE